MNKELDKYKSTAEALSLLLYPHAEVVIHDLKSDRIAAIYNSFSKRKVGDESLIDEILRTKNLPDVFPPYFKTNWDGRSLKSVTSTLRDQKGNPIGLFCINLDLSKWEEVQKFVMEWTRGMGALGQPEILFKEDWREKINLFVSDYLRKEGMSLKFLSKDKKKELVGLLHKKGAFQAKNAAAYIADVLDMSRATIYNYLRQQ